MDSAYRLPRTVVPSRYELVLCPDLEAASFKGHEVVTIEVREPVQEVVLNAIDLEVSDVEVVSEDGGLRIVASTVEYDEAAERVTFRFDRLIEPGSWQLLASFRGILNDDLQGFYRSTYKDAAGNDAVIATTQFEATDARRAFPCWDEPDFKATFAITLEVAAGLVAISNGREISVTAGSEGTEIHTFAETIKMPTYLVAFIVGDFEVSGPVDAGGVPLRVLHTPGKGHLAEFALEAGAFALDYFADYYGIPYPGDKLDMIGIPDFAWGAMENLGAVTYREMALLVDRNRATQAELARVADVVAHELAHMWFGDLVTMKWWNGIWLNEAFATFMELKCVDAFRPEWKRWLSFAHFRAQSMDVDGLSATRPVEYPVQSPEEANAMFDTLTYGKGSALMRMLEQYLGEEVFRKGIGAYLRQHAFGNTETSDLWAALEEASGEPVGEIMGGWIYQGGYPQLDVRVGDEGLEVTQRHFRFVGDGESGWQVPARYRIGDEQHRILVGQQPVVLPNDPGLVLNSGGDGFYRVGYPKPMLTALAAEFGELQPAERYTLLADTWANVLAGTTPGAEFVRLLDALPGEPEPDVWGVAAGGVAELSRILSPGDRRVLEDLVRGLTEDQIEALGWEAEPGETDLQKKLRAVLLRTAGNIGDDLAVQAQAGDVFAATLASTDVGS